MYCQTFSPLGCFKTLWQSDRAHKPSSLQIQRTASRHYSSQTVHTNHRPYRFSGLLQDIMAVRPCTQTIILTGSVGCFKTLWQSDRAHKPSSLQVQWAASRHYGSQTVHTNHHPYRFNGLLQDITVRPCTQTIILTGSMGCFKTSQSDRAHKPSSLQVQWAALRHHSQTVHTNHHPYRFNGLLRDITVRPCTQTIILTGSMGCFKTL